MPSTPVMIAAVGKSGPGMFHQRLNVRFGLVDEREAGADDLIEIVRRDIGRHADGDAGRAVDQQVRQSGRQHQRLVFRAVVVGREVDGFLFEIGQHLVGDAAHADFGVAHRRRRVAVDRTEVALTVDQHVAQREILRHAHDGVVHRDVAVRVVLTDDVTDHARRFFVGLVVVVAELVHGEQHAPVHWLQPVAHVRQRPPHDHAHGVIEVRAAHLVFEIDRDGFLGELFHAQAGANAL